MIQQSHQNEELDSKVFVLEHEFILSLEKSEKFSDFIDLLLEIGHTILCVLQKMNPKQDFFSLETHKWKDLKIIEAMEHLLR